MVKTNSKKHATKSKCNPKKAKRGRLEKQMEAAFTGRLSRSNSSMVVAMSDLSLNKQLSFNSKLNRNNSIELSERNKN